MRALKFTGEHGARTATRSPASATVATARSSSTDAATISIADVRALVALTVEIEREAEAWIRDQQEADTKATALRDIGADVERQRILLAEQSKHGVCPLCAHPLTAFTRHALDDVLVAQRESVAVDHQYYAARVEQLGAEPPRLASLLERRSALITKMLGTSDEASAENVKNGPGDSESYFDRFPDVLDEEPQSG